MDTKTPGRMPQCIGIIMDGNRRWAKEQGKPALFGHQAGARKVKELGDWIVARGIPHVVLYAFSTENWHRTKEEVNHIMKLFQSTFEKEFDTFREKKVKVQFIGEREQLPKGLLKEMERLEDGTKEYTNTCLTIALSYGGRAEIVHALKKVCAEGEITEDSIGKALWSASIPDPDIIIRTSGEKRLSNFLPWQSVYSELFFVDTHWPAFSEEEFANIIEAYGKRERREGR